jgi:uncharacterized NAD-dependent epimerase/dehydratase family protein
LETIRNYPQIPLPPMSALIAKYEEAARWVRPQGMPPAKVVGISVNTSALPETDAKAYLNRLADETGLPVTDPVRYGVSNLMQALRLDPVNV